LNENAVYVDSMWYKSMAYTADDKLFKLR